MRQSNVLEQSLDLILDCKIISKDDGEGRIVRMNDSFLRDGVALQVCLPML